MKFNNILVFVLILSTYSVTSQSFAFGEAIDVRTLSNSRSSDWIKKESRKPEFVEAYIAKIENTNIINEENIDLHFGSNRIAARFQSSNIRKKDDYAWYGTMEDGFSCFFTVSGKKVFGKFYHEELAYTLMPLNESEHILIGYNIGMTDKECGNGGKAMTSKIPRIKKSNSRAFSSDDNCNVRLLGCITQSAIAELAPGTNPSMIAQSAIDEGNMALNNSAIGFNLELAGIFFTPYVEVDSVVLSPEGECKPRDLIDLKLGVPPFDIMHNRRDYYDADMVFILRNSNFDLLGDDDCSDKSLFGVAYHTPEYGDPVDESKSFFICDISGITVGRFSFIHEAGHLMGAHHETTSQSPGWAVAFKLGPNDNSLRTLMHRNLSCSSLQGCRIQNFSNPNVTYNGNATGTANADNARRLNEIADTIKGHRITPNGLSLINETFEDGYRSNHLAKSHILKGASQTILAEDGSTVTLRADNYILIQPGFQALSGSKVRMYLENTPCDDLPVEGLKEDILVKRE